MKGVCSNCGVGGHETESCPHPPRSQMNPGAAVDGKPTGTVLAHNRATVSNKGYDAPGRLNASRICDECVTVSRGNLFVVMNDTFEDLSEDDRVALDLMLPAGNVLDHPVKVSFESLREHVSDHASTDEVLDGLRKMQRAEL